MRCTALATLAATRRRRPLGATLLGGVIIVLGAPAAAGATAPVTTPGTAVATPAAGGEFSLAAAVANIAQQATKDSRTELDMTVAVMGQRITMTGVTDTDAATKRGRSTTKMDFGALLGGQTSGSGPGAVPGAIEIDMITDIEAMTSYMSTGSLPLPGLSGGAKYMKLDLKRMGGAALAQAMDVSAGGQAAVLVGLDVSAAVDKGRVTQAGEELQRYELAVDVRKAIAANPAAAGQLGQLDQLGSQLPELVPATIFVTRDNRIRQTDISIDMSIEGQTVTMDMSARMIDVTEDISIELPDPAEVVDAPDSIYQQLSPSTTPGSSDPTVATIPALTGATTAATTPATTG